MKAYTGEHIRNVGIVGHGDTGKAQLVSSLLFTAGMTNRLGNVAEGNTVTDWDEEETARKITIKTGLAYAEYAPPGQTEKTKINFLDTPGYSTFINETKASLIAADCALILVDAVAGVRVVTEKVWDYCTEYDIPSAFVLNWMDRELASFERANFVNNKRFRKALPKMGSHTKSMVKLGLQTQTIVTSQEIITPPDFIAEKLLPPGGNKAIFVERVSYLEDEPVCMIRAYYPLKYSNILSDVDLNNKSIYSLLQNCYSIVPKRAETIVSVVFADDLQSNLLSIRDGVPLLHLGSFTWTENDELFEYSSGYYRIDRFELELEQS